MSGPYIHGLSENKRKYCRKRSRKNEENEESQFFFSSEDHAPAMEKKRRVSHVDAEVIPKFRPEDNTSNVSSWLHKIDQLGEIYGWDATEKQFLMQLRLRGSARRWYDDLDDYNLDWDGWKRALEMAFPRSTDFVSRLEEMLARTKKDSETMTNYFHDKLSLIKKCNIVGENAISCIIRGLPVELQANAKAYKCRTPQLLYYGYLSSFENYKRIEAATPMRKSLWKRGTTDGSSATDQQTGVRQCYICRRLGHVAQDCRSKQRCENCQRNGHTSATCWAVATPGSTQQRSSSLVSHILFTTTDVLCSVYKRHAYIGTEKLVVYIDTGSKLNILTQNKATLLKLPIAASTTVMRGFGGTCIQSLGRSQITVHIDKICLSGYVEITNYELSDIDLIIGQPMINQSGVSLVTTSSSAKFVETLAVDDCIKCVKLENLDYNCKFNVYLKCDVTLPAQSVSLIDVTVNIEPNDNLYFLTNSVYMQLGK
ncbi:unnamed protein product [Parnassius mnemosyne]|uniref:CCHC-type domain-containing protein n=1 Tax=Parnassius mnemosyne TaxID=213953 RepID=A0AAV1LAG6_9NEOP